MNARYVLAMAIVVFAAACAAGTPTPSQKPSDGVAGTPSGPPSDTAPRPVSTSSLVVLPSPPEVGEELPLSCGSPLTFNAAALLGPGGAESADHPAAAALRDVVADGSLPSRAGWRVVVLNATHALLLLPGLPAEGSAFWNAEFEKRGSWAYVRSGQCDVRPAFVGVEPARWDLLSPEVLERDTRSFEVLVTELGCASGQSPEGRVVAAVLYLEASITIFAATRPLAGAQTCDPGPPARIMVELAEPIGNRSLFDGSVIPPELRAAPQAP